MSSKRHDMNGFAYYLTLLLVYSPAKLSLQTPTVYSNSLTNTYAQQLPCGEYFLNMDFQKTFPIFLSLSHRHIKCLTN